MVDETNNTTPQNDAVLVRIRSIDGVNVTKNNPVGDQLKGKKVGILLSPFAPKVTPIALSAMIDAYQAAGAIVSVGILSNYIYNEESAKGNDISALTAAALDKKLAAGETLLQNRLEEVFDPKLNPDVTFNRVLEDSNVPLVYGKGFSGPDFNNYVGDYHDALKKADFVQHVDDTVNKFVESNHKDQLREARENNSRAFLKLEGPQYALWAQQLDYISYHAAESPLLRACREFVPKESRAGFIECNSLQPLVADTLKNGKLDKVHRDGGGVSDPRYSYSTMSVVYTERRRRTRSSSDPKAAEIRAQVVQLFAEQRYDEALKVISGIDTDGDPKLETMVDDLTIQLEGLAELMQQQVTLQMNVSVAGILRTLNGYGKRNGRSPSPETNRFRSIDASPNIRKSVSDEALSAQATARKLVSAARTRSLDAGSPDRGSSSSVLFKDSTGVGIGAFDPLVPQTQVSVGLSPGGE